ncbi:hypothetical protein [Cryptosporangium aurantiacum]|uniref:Sugar lactone lactonase YvrE n=1 Tax=Cryptosporangium aurantiacum TaxID=134849 RepID=A0A1M7RI95_9ACTN|nr:hypothetical protein [Cryptosporangium aurantiacum]SHN45881.1 hypothetical protein SAMN05443668_11365 [Cryptosporangium aurantiacum]
MATRLAVKAVRAAISLSVVGSLFPIVRAVAAPAVGRPVTRCVVADRRLGQISGLVERPGGFSVVNDTGPVIWRLDAGCRPIRRTVLRPPAPRDPDAVPLGGKRFDTEDIALDASGTFWIADIGGNTGYRLAVSLFRWRVGTAATAVARYDLRYPDGAHDAEAMLVTRRGAAVLVTKTAGAAGVYVADAPLRPTGWLRLVGRFDVRRACPACRARSRLITGGAVSRDGTRAVLRTYDRAFEWYAPDGNIARALVTRAPRQIRLPASRQGEAIAYTTDARTLLTATERIPAPIGAVPIRG